MGTINDLQLISSVTDSINIPGDNGTQTYRITTAQLKSYMQTAFADLFVPVGAVLPFGGTSAPSGFLLCNGSAVSRSTYSSLFSVIGTAHGEGDGSTTFNIPDYRGRFLRGVDGSEGNDPDAASRTAMNTGGNTGDSVGSIQGDATKKNGLSLTDPGHTHPTDASFYRGVGGAANFTDSGVLGIGGSAHNTNSNTTGISLGGGDNETRPVNASVNYIIKI